MNHWRGPTRLVREILFRRNDLAEVGVMGTITFARKRPPASRNRLSALASLVAIEFVTLLRGRRMGFGPVNVASDDR